MSLARIRPATALALVVLACVASAAPAVADPSDPEAGLETRIFDIRFKSVEDVVLLIEPYIGDRGSYMVQPRLKAITVRDEPSRLARIGDLISSFDQPPRSVRLAIQLLDAVEASPTGRRRGTGGTRLDSVLGVTKWTDYSILGEASIIGVEGARSALNISERYRVRFSVDAVADRQGVARFDQFALDRITKDADGEIRYTSILDTSLNLHDGQRLLLGITSSQESTRALFVSVRATLEPSGPVSPSEGE